MTSDGCKMPSDISRKACPSLNYSEWVFECWRNVDKDIADRIRKGATSD